MNYMIIRAISLRSGDTLYRPVIDVTIEAVEQKEQDVICTYTNGTSEVFHWRDLLFVSCPHRRYSERYI